jgi:hypothetical protein
MPTIRIRMTGSRDDADTLLNILHGIDGVEHVEEIEDETAEAREDSSSNELVDDNGAELFLIEVLATDRLHADAVRAVTEVQSSQLDSVVEIVDEF